MKEKMISSIEEKLIEVNEIYNRQLATQPQESLSSVDILSDDTLKKLRTFIDYFINTG